ncbi:MAG: hypothetical protein VX770_02775 [Candidatus Neomarinimicrobiota bacterium]|jgi:hypothetical protein|nr:hypothetical protein [Candidatus Neomarinimicrobiota bacterium]
MKIINTIKKIISYLLLPLHIIIFYIIKPKTVVILGMHRSGTSCITRILNKCGLSLGSETIKPDKGNPYGYWENLSVFWINKRILNASNGSWDNPPKKLYENVYIKFEILRTLYARNWFNPDLLIKDPSLVITWKIWEKYLRFYKVVIVFRNPKSVACSLRKRDKMPIKEGIELWEKYNNILLSDSIVKNAIFLDFDNDAAFKKKFKKIGSFLKINFKPKYLKFFNPSFKTFGFKNNHKRSKTYKNLLNKC